MKLWAIGDSFLINEPISTNWIDIFRNEKGIKKYYKNGDSSRDFQTILDIFLQNIYLMQPDDLVILMFPDARWRIPKRGKVTGHDNHLHTNYHIGQGSYVVGQEDPTLESFRNEISDDDGLLNTYNLMAQDASPTKKNYIRILKSIKWTFPFKIIYMSWSNYIDVNLYHPNSIKKEPLVWNKTYLEKKIGFWETKGDVYDRGDDVSDTYQWDAHWSPEMHKRVAKFMLKEL
jgi:hypothetical protein